MNLVFYFIAVFSLLQLLFTATILQARAGLLQHAVIFNLLHMKPHLNQQLTFTQHLRTRAEVMC